MDVNAASSDRLENVAIRRRQSGKMSSDKVPTNFRHTTAELNGARLKIACGMMDDAIFELVFELFRKKDTVV
ncbi:hypothetical protein EVAR_50553_1 [Eumeta japonica]|uniref:Uncharacterized protein n=1 Tax=Eumeta variegata TaxID=151549 RepID=A0A4C2ADM9_EUMVA|nr:hypothetical protein EVAR_50553_1 [Eumeta japonica]